MHNLETLMKSFEAAINGIKQVSQEKNFRIHMIAAAIVLGVILFMDTNIVTSLILLLLVNNVLSMEVMNSAVEELSEQQRNLGISYEDAGPARDLAAGAVLINAITAVIVGFIVLLPVLADLF